MTTAWRIDRSVRGQAEAFSGEGARQAGGRWNHRGVSVVYGSDSLALAALELFVHLDRGARSIGFTAYRIEIPRSLPAERADPAALPGGWRRRAAVGRTRDFGSAWVARAETAVLAVPSAIVPEERNLVLNPAHSDFRRIRIVHREPFSFDPRMWK